MLYSFKYINMIITNERLMQIGLCRRHVVAIFETFWCVLPKLFGSTEELKFHDAKENFFTQHSKKKKASVFLNYSY